VGDFNTVAWSRSAILFRKTSGLLDPRIGRGLIPTFHAKYWFLRFPIDQLYYSTDIFIDNIHTLPNIGSDHFPVYCSFHINKKITVQEEETIDLEKGELKIVNELIAEGKSEQSDR
jgi:endonuclease/exonuclease/phosphatase (EEP) superfamily protein YafD